MPAKSTRGKSQGQCAYNISLLLNVDDDKCDPDRCPINEQSTRPSQPRLDKGKATMRCHDELGLLTSIKGPIPGTWSGSLQMAAKGQALTAINWLAA
jgi:hypothetical protein